MTDFLTSKQWGQVFAHAWDDPAFKDRLEKDPKSAIEEIGDQIGLKGGEVLHAVPDRPRDMTDEQVQKIKSGDDDVHFHPAYCC